MRMTRIDNGGNTHETSRSYQHRSSIFDPGALPVFAQEHEQDELKPSRTRKRRNRKSPAKPEEKPAAQEEKNAKPEEKNAQQEEKRQAGREECAAKRRTPSRKRRTHSRNSTPAGNGDRIPADRYKANFGREHTFRVSEGDYSNHRFQYGGYWFGFVGPWPSNWLYTQNVYVIEIDGVYYLCNPMYPGVNLELTFTL